MEVLEIGGNTMNQRAFELVKEAAGKGVDVAYDVPERNQSDNIVANASVERKKGGGGVFGSGVEVTGGGVAEIMKQAGWKMGNFE
jgi:hypothetical protein